MSHNRLGALFDLDGVIIDSEGAYTEFWAEIGRRYGAPSPTFALDIKGTTLTDILSRHFPDPEVSNRIKKELYEFESEAPFPLFEGAVDLLLELGKFGIARAMVTSSDQTKMNSLRRRHPGLEDMFDVVVNGSMVSRSKPDPEGYLLAAQKLAVPIGLCAVFEDSLQGLEAGRNAHAGAVIGIATTNPVERIAPLCDLVIPSLRAFSRNRLEALLRKA